MTENIVNSTILKQPVKARLISERTESLNNIIDMYVSGLSFDRMVKKYDPIKGEAEEAHDLGRINALLSVYGAYVVGDTE